MLIIESLFVILNVIILFYFLFINGTYLYLNFLSFFRVRKFMQFNPFIQKEKAWQSLFSRPITLVVPAYNESKNVVTSIRALLQMYYPVFEVILVNDGSTDDTLQKLIEAFDLKITPRMPTAYLETEMINRSYYSEQFDNLLILDKQNGGKSDAINAGINFSRYPLVCVIDADSILERDAFIKMVRPFVEDPDTVAVGGIVRIVNSTEIRHGEVLRPRLSRKSLVRFQVVEYLRAFLFGRVGWDELNSLLIISGAFGLYRRESLVSVGGYVRETIGEDMELTIRLHKYYNERKEPYRITFVPEPVCWTEVPEDLRSLKSQRNRWQRGLMQSLILHKDMFLNPKYGKMGIFAFPFFIIGEMLSPVVEIGGLIIFFLSWYLGFINAPFAVLFLLIAVGLSVLLSVSSINLEEFAYHRYTRFTDLFILLLFAVLENFGYRQIQSYFRLTGIFDFLKGKQEWGKMQRKGF